MGNCRGKTCTADILWGYTTAGRRIPLNPVPVADGNALLVDRDDHDRPIVRILKQAEMKQGELVPLVGARYQTHWQTCPDEKSFR